MDKQLKENSAVCEITGFDKGKITKDLLYGVSHKLYSLKSSLEQHLFKRTNELFDLEDKIIQYDLTNTYFEGRMQGSKITKFGRSKEKRSDAKIVVLAVVVNREGLLKYSNIFEGNMSDCKTLETMIDTINLRTSITARKPIVVIHLGLLAYWLVATIRFQLKQKEFCSDWRKIVRTMNAQKCVTTSIVNIKEETISVRQCTEPSQHVKNI